MDTPTAEAIRRQPPSLLAEAARGAPALILENGQPVFMPVPVGEGLVPTRSACNLRPGDSTGRRTASASPREDGVFSSPRDRHDTLRVIGEHLFPQWVDQRPDAAGE